MNNREIKFRVWNKNEKKFIPTNSRTGVVLIDLEGKLRIAEWSSGNGSNDADSVYSPIENQEDFIIQQYVEAKDKNGKEIYDGDIVKIWHDSYTNWIRDYSLVVVIWYYNRWTVRTSSENPIKRDTALFFPNNEENLEVVGNILEHPHMVRI